MNRHQTIGKQHFEPNFLRSVSIGSARNYVAAADGQSPVAKLNCGGIRKIISGRLLSVHANEELPVEGAKIEIHAVKPLKWVANTLPKAVLGHCRTLLLEKLRPIDLYRSSGHVADTPLVSFSDVLQVRDIPGCELLAAAARSQTDDSFRHLLGSNSEIARLLLCYYHPASFSCAPVADATTDETGLFQCTLLEADNADDRSGHLFIARHTISSNLYVTLYKPMPATWHTYWKWPANNMVTLRTSHPLVRRQPTLA